MREGEEKGSGKGEESAPASRQIKTAGAVNCRGNNKATRAGDESKMKAALMNYKL